MERGIDLELLKKDQNMAEVDDFDFDKLEQLVELGLSTGKLVAIGEIGLDYYWRQDNKDAQKVAFEAQLKLAREFSLPVIIHDREAHGDCFETVLKYPDIKGVFHSYSGSAEMAKEFVKLGFKEESIENLIATATNDSLFHLPHLLKEKERSKKRLQAYYSARQKD